MKGKKILIGLIIVLIIVASIYFFVQKIKEESKLNTQRMNAIVNINSNLEKNILDFNGARSTLTFRIKETYTDNLNDKYQLIMKQLNKEESYLKNSKSNAEKLDNYCNGLRPRTIDSYKGTIDRYIIPCLDKSKLTALPPENVQGFVDLLSAGYKGQDPVSSKTVQNIHGVLHSVLRRAVLSGVITANHSVNRSCWVSSGRT